MAAGLQFAWSLFTSRLVRICVNRLGHQGCGLNPTGNITSCLFHTRRFSTSPKGKKGETESERKESPDMSPETQTPMQTMVTWGPQFGKRRPLSPLERISRLLPPECLAPEVVQLREETSEMEPYEVGVKKDQSTLSSMIENETISLRGEAQSAEQDSHTGQDTVIKNILIHPVDTFLSDGTAFAEEEGCIIPKTKSLLPGERLLTFGEVLLAEYRKKDRVEFRKMFQLQDGQRLQSSWGTIEHSDIAGFHAGDIIKTIHGVPIIIRRPTLEEYVLYMKRGPNIAYPKDASIMLMMMDVTEGDHVLEAGSGSGAMSLFLSRAVGSKGRVFSMEIREDHHRRAVLNFNRWRSSWSIRRGEEWPENVCFHNADLQGASALLDRQGFHSIALDMLNPHLALPIVTPNLLHGAVCAIYLANITQVVDLLEGLRCSNLPLRCERIFEVQLRDWLLAAAIQKDGQFCRRKAPPSARSQEVEQKGQNDQSEDKENESAVFGSVPYIARPHPEQLGHTAFLVKLRKSREVALAHPGKPLLRD
ncbi:hypothetical protein UPYG_G00233670 [Umbra pygmaea]|uniref:tRNA (adenine(58)-N(1))-methyltransferase n=1 Tax=Umbra pygmaea TaxID=75934 RepID=A0ABD0WY83_UMBPY